MTALLKLVTLRTKPMIVQISPDQVADSKVPYPEYGSISGCGSR